MAIIQTPSIAAVVEDQSPVLGGDLDGGGNTVSNVRRLSIEDAAGETYGMSVSFGTTLYFQPASGDAGAYLFRGNSASRYLQLSSQTATGRLQCGTSHTSGLELRSNNANASVTLNPATGGTPALTANADLSIDCASDVSVSGDITTNGLATGVETFTAASDTLDSSNHTCLCDCTLNAITINLPVGVSGTQYVIKKTDATANAVTIDANGAELIDGAGTATITTQYESITIVSDGSNWFTT